MIGIVTLEDVIGPKTGKLRAYRGKQIPRNNTIPLQNISIILCEKCINIKPKLIPKSPVVNGNINNSVGSNNSNKTIVRM